MRITRSVVLIFYSILCWTGDTIVLRCASIGWAWRRRECMTVNLMEWRLSKVRTKRYIPFCPLFFFWKVLLILLDFWHFRHPLRFVIIKIRLLILTVFVRSNSCILFKNFDEICNITESTFLGNFQDIFVCIFKHINCSVYSITV